MDIAIPHDLGREEVRKRLADNSHKIGESIPGGMAQITTNWPSEDRMAMSINAMGQVLQGHIDVEDKQVVVHMLLPPALGFLQPMIEAAIRDQGQRMLEPPRD
ncbi:polyhydroxyalkanoic acid system family protein [Aurantiacibacter poecillastricola]|uniref:polyhydroxyalkanoic acid system family protein n=1 Tax=Aurantiacibacter poecillastricola TaxID=3064385 RepID=UPI00273EB62A|nr:polyhydroxyalkanoic acid system family protein [Aurantiacibacter sp. 219JJ12-13]MDP5260111.1 polyhydroxyalkanoic acid system family protein [Aurantiacibacter sp. 219JJ12-13]